MANSASRWAHSWASASTEREPLAWRIALDLSLVAAPLGLHLAPPLQPGLRITYGLAANCRQSGSQCHLRRVERRLAGGEVLAARGDHEATEACELEFDRPPDHERLRRVDVPAGDADALARQRSKIETSGGRDQACGCFLTVTVAPSRLTHAFGRDRVGRQLSLRAPQPLLGDRALVPRIGQLERLGHQARGRDGVARPCRRRHRFGLCRSPRLRLVAQHLDLTLRGFGALGQLGQCRLEGQRLADQLAAHPVLRGDPGLIGRRRLHGLDRRPTALLEIREFGEGAAGCLATLTRPSDLVLLDQTAQRSPRRRRQLIDPGVELAPPRGRARHAPRRAGAAARRRP